MFRNASFLISPILINEDKYSFTAFSMGDIGGKSFGRVDKTLSGESGKADGSCYQRGWGL